MINLPTKFEVPSFTRYEDMKDVENAQTGVGLVLAGYGSPRIISNVTMHSMERT